MSYIRTIKSKHIGVNGKLYRSDAWVSNGHWAIPSAELPASLQTREGLIAAVGMSISDHLSIDSVLTASSEKATSEGWEVTGWLY